MAKAFSDFEQVTPAVPLVPVADVKAWFKITDTSMDPQIELSVDAISDLIRTYLGRYLFPVASFKETWEDGEYVQCRLREWPISLIDSGADVLNRSTGLVIRTSTEVLYDSGMVRLPASLTAIFYQLVKQQMAVFGFPDFGSESTSQPVRSVSIGNLKVDYSSGSTDSQANVSATAGALTEDALRPYYPVLDHYRSDLVWAAT